MKDCQQCGAPLNGNPMAVSWTCEYCQAVNYNESIIRKHAEAIDYSKAHNLLQVGMAAFEGDDFETALSSFEKVLAEDSASLDAWVYAALSTAHLCTIPAAERSIKKVRSYLKRAEAINPDSDVLAVGEGTVNNVIGYRIVQELRSLSDMGKKAQKSAIKEEVRSGRSTAFSVAKSGKEAKQEVLAHAIESLKTLHALQFSPSDIRIAGELAVETLYCLADSGKIEPEVRGNAITKLAQIKCANKKVYRELSANLGFFLNYEIKNLASKMSSNENSGGTAGSSELGNKITGMLQGMFRRRVGTGKSANKKVVSVVVTCAVFIALIGVFSEGKKQNSANSSSSTTSVPKAASPVTQPVPVNTQATSNPTPPKNNSETASTTKNGVTELQSAVDTYDAKAQANIKQAQELIDKKAFDEAVQLLQETVRMNPAYPETYRYLGRAYFQQSQFEKALECYQKAVEYKPDYTEAKCWLGVTLIKMKELDKAFSVLSEASQATPAYPESYYWLGMTSYFLDRWPDAVTAFEQYIQHDEKNVDAYYTLGLCRFNLKRYQDAVTSLQKAVQLKPDNAEIHYWLGVSQFLNGNPEAAKAEYTTLTTLDPAKAEELRKILDPKEKEVSTEQAPQQAEWKTGKWNRVASSEKESGVLEISKIEGQRFSYKLVAQGGDHFGEIEGIADIKQGGAVSSFSDTGCEVKFILKGTRLIIETNDSCYIYAGTGAVAFGGEFVQGDASTANAAESVLTTGAVPWTTGTWSRGEETVNYLELKVVKIDNLGLYFKITGENGGDGYDLEGIAQIQGSKALFKAAEGACQTTFSINADTITITPNDFCWSDNPCFVCGDLVKNTPAAARQ